MERDGVRARRLGREPMRLYHFSDDPAITRLVPRAVAVDGPRAPDREWLNGPLVWAIDQWHSPAYLFPRACPRVLWWPLPDTTETDRERYWGTRRDTRMVACIEWAWLERLRSTALYRYTLPPAGFIDVRDHGVHVNHSEVMPTAMTVIDELPEALARANVELRLMASLTPLRGMWETTLHVSGIRLRNAQGWSTNASTPTAPAAS